MARPNREIVQAIFDAFAEEDWNTIRSLVHDDIQVFEADSLPYAGLFKGPDNFIALNQKVFDTWEDSHHTIDHIIADGDHVVILGNMAGRGKATGQAFSVPMAAVWRLEDGKVIEVRPFYFDTKVMHDAHFGSANSGPGSR
jgi:ketosteroid isomerase-like protein